MIKKILIAAAVIVIVVIALWQFLLVESLPPETIVKPVIGDFKNDEQIFYPVAD